MRMKFSPTKFSTVRNIQIFDDDLNPLEFLICYQTLLLPQMGYTKVSMIHNVVAKFFRPSPELDDIRMIVTYRTHIIGMVERSPAKKFLSFT